KVISTVANALAPSIPAAAKVASVSSALGYGRRRVYRKRKVGGRKRRVVRRRGRGLLSALKSAHNWLKSNKVISTVSKALDSAGVPYAGTINKISSAAGYGKYRSRKRRTRRVGRGSTFFSLSQIARPKF